MLLIHLQGPEQLCTSVLAEPLSSSSCQIARPRWAMSAHACMSSSDLPSLTTPQITMTTQHISDDTGEVAGTPTHMICKESIPTFGDRLVE